MQRYSAEWIEAEVKAKGAQMLLHHDCSICTLWTSYLFIQGEVFYNSGCGCGSGGFNPRPSSYGSVAEWLAMQSSDAQREIIWGRLK